MMTDEKGSYLSAMLTDFYQITISQSYFKEGRQDEPSCFDLFYRTQPFGGSFAVFAGLNECLRFLRSYKFEEGDLDYIKENLGGDCDAFIDYLRHIDTSKIKIFAPPAGTIVFPKEPLLRVEGPLAYCQLIETPLLNAINFPTLMCTNALRFRCKTGMNKKLLEFGLRRAQGTDGGMAASKYSYMGLFDCTSNILAGKMYNIPISGTVAHSFVTSFYGLEQLKSTKLVHNERKNEEVDLLPIVLTTIKECNFTPNISETAAFIAQACCYPNNFLALVDTYDTMKSGVPNFLAVSRALHAAGYKGKGVRLDSGDLSDLSKKTRKMFIEFGEKYNIDYAKKYSIAASNDINEVALTELEKLGHEIDIYGIGTHLVTCERQPALGGVYKLVEVKGIPRVKLSDQIFKSTIPGRKELYRCYDASGKEIADLLVTVDEKKPVPGKIKGFQVYPEGKEIEIDVAELKPLYHHVFGDNADAKLGGLKEARERVLDAYNNFNKDVLSVDNESQYCVFISDELRNRMNKLIAENKVK